MIIFLGGIVLHHCEEGIQTGGSLLSGKDQGMVAMWSNSVHALYRSQKGDG